MYDIVKGFGVTPCVVSSFCVGSTNEAGLAGCALDSCGMVLEGVVAFDASIEGSVAEFDASRDGLVAAFDASIDGSMVAFDALEGGLVAVSTYIPVSLCGFLSARSGTHRVPTAG